MNVSKKSIRPGDTVTITATVYNGGVGEPNWCCGWCNWIASGTDTVSFTSLPGEVVDYSPREIPGQLTVSPYTTWIQWGAVDPERPPQHISEHVYCHCIGEATQGEGEPDNPLYRFRAGQTFTVTCHVPDNASISRSWTKVEAYFGGNICALGWGDGATDYWAVNGDMSLMFAPPNPDTIPANGKSTAALNAVVSLKEGGTRLHSQEVFFSTTLGCFAGGSQTASAISGPDGTVTVSIVSDKNDGVADIRAWIPDGPEAHCTVEFKKPDYDLEISADPEEIENDGKSKSTVTATLTADGDPVAGEDVRFTTNLGQFLDESTETFSETFTATTDSEGHAVAILVSSTDSGKATVTAEYDPEASSGESLKKRGLAGSAKKTAQQEVQWGPVFEIYVLQCTELDGMIVPADQVEVTAYVKKIVDVDTGPSVEICLYGDWIDKGEWVTVSDVPAGKGSFNVDLTGRIVDETNEDVFDQLLDQKKPIPLKENTGLHIKWTQKGKAKEQKLDDSTLEKLTGETWEITYPDYSVMTGDPAAPSDLPAGVSFSAVLDFYKTGNTDSTGTCREDLLPADAAMYGKYFGRYGNYKESPYIRKWALKAARNTSEYAPDDVETVIGNLYGFINGRFSYNWDSGGLRMYEVAQKLENKENWGTICCWGISYTLCGFARTLGIYSRETNNFLRYTNAFYIPGVTASPWVQHTCAQLYYSGDWHWFDLSYGQRDDAFPEFYLNTFYNSNWGAPYDMIRTYTAIRPIRDNDNLVYGNGTKGEPALEAATRWLFYYSKQNGWLWNPVLTVESPLRNLVIDSAGRRLGSLGPFTSAEVWEKGKPGLLQSPAVINEIPNSMYVPPNSILGHNDGDPASFTLLHEAIAFTAGQSPQRFSLVSHGTGSGPFTVRLHSPGDPAPTVLFTRQGSASPAQSSTLSLMVDTSGATPVVTLADPTGRVELDPDPPLHGDTVVVYYHAEWGPISGASAVNLYWAAVHDGAWSNPATVAMSATTTPSLWMASITAPTQSNLIGMRFNDGQGHWDDNSGNDWILPVVDEPVMPTPTPSPTPSPTPASPATDVRVIAGYQQGDQVREHMERVLNPLGLTYEILYEDAPTSGPGVQPQQLAQTSLVIYSNDGQSGRQMDTLESLIAARDAGIPLLILDNDMAFSYVYASPDLSAIIRDLTRFGAVEGTGEGILHGISTSDYSHPVWKGVGPFYCGSDIDRLSSPSLNTTTLAVDHRSQPVMHFYTAGSGAKVLVSLLDFETEPYPPDRMAQNAILWLMGRPALSAPHNLTLGDVTAPPEISVGMPAHVQWTVTNSGTTSIAASWNDCVYLSSDTLAGNDIRLTSLSSPDSLDKGANYVRDLTVPMPVVPPGSYWLIVQADADGTVGETNETDNQQVVGPVTVAVPNLAIGAVDVALAGVPGERIPIAWTCTNTAANTATGIWSDCVYLSNDPAIGDDRFLAGIPGPDSVNGLASYEGATTFTVPSVPAGVYWIIAKVNAAGILVETTTDDNHRVMGPFAVSRPDLEPLEFHAPPTAQLGVGVPVDWRVKNQGTGKAVAPWSDGIYLSTDNQPGDDTLLADLRHRASLPGGEPYDATATLALPSLPEGDYYFVLNTDSGAEVVETNDANNARVAGPIKVGGPDLTVSEFQPPVDIRPQETLAVTWNVRNVGKSLASGTWTDCLYVSSEPGLGGMELLLGYATRTETLPTDGSYDVSLSVTLPEAPEGDYWFVAHTDRMGSLAETNEGNNQIVAGPVRLRFCNIVARDLSSPLKLGVRDSIAVQWTVENSGLRTATAYKAWKDVLYLSSDPVFGDDIVLKDVDRVRDLSAGESYVQNVTAQVPVLDEGNYWLFVRADNESVLIETHKSDNVASFGPVTIIRPNMVVRDLAAPTSPTVELVVGQPAFLQWTDWNLGEAKAFGQWTDQVVLSADTAYGGDTQAAAITHWRNLDAGDHLDVATTVTVPNVAEGLWYWIVRTDRYDIVKESNENDNYTAIGPVRVRRPNLISHSLEAPTEIISNRAVRVRWKDMNASPSARAYPTWRDDLFLSTDPLPGSDRSCGNFYQRQILEPGTSVDCEIEAYVPSLAAGTYYWILRTDASSSLGETDENDNVVVLGPVTLRNPNLTIEHVTTPTMAVLGQTFKVEYGAANTGTVPVEYIGTWGDAFFISEDDVFQTGDSRIGYLTYDPPPVIQPGESYDVSTTFTVPTAPIGDFYFLVYVNYSNSLQETDRNDNIMAVGPIHVAGADLTPSGTLTLPAQIGIGEPLDIVYRVRNIGNYPTAGSWIEKVYLSPNTYVSSQSKLLKETTQTRVVGVDGFYEVAATVEIPPVSAANYYILVQIDTAYTLTEVDENNNLQVSGPMSVFGPDLTPSNLAVNTEQLATGILDAQWTITNSGAAPANLDWVDCAYLSDDRYVGSDTRISSSPKVKTLNPGESYTGHLVAPIPSSPTGNYWIVIVTDSDQTQFETDEGNNTIIRGPYPVEGSGEPDFWILF